jgi:hypothetical protein
MRGRNLPKGKMQEAIRERVATYSSNARLACFVLTHSITQLNIRVPQTSLQAVHMATNFLIKTPNRNELMLGTDDARRLERRIRDLQTGSPEHLDA